MDNDYSSSSSEIDNILGRIFFKKYQCIKKLGEGSFGLIYEAIYNNEHFASKFEDLRRNTNLLEAEASIMNYLKGPNIPSVRSFGTSGNYNVLIMQLMGKSLEDLINEKKTFSIKTVCLLGYQMINVLEYIHDKHYVHRDIKPDNFVMGLNSQSKKLYLLDFGLAKKYRSSTTLVHYPLINKKKLTGTARYASINAMRG
jgi:serine/threonine protein kinase